MEITQKSIKHNQDMKNIHVLPTDKPSTICKIDNVLVLSKIGTLTNGTKSLILQNIYITSDEEIKEWYIYEGRLLRASVNHSKYELLYGKPITLTTDQDLIKDGVQAIDDEFLEFIVKNPSCEEVEVKPLLSNNGRAFYGYKTIIPKEEPKMIECYFIPSNNTSSATICGNCGKEKFLHTIGSGIKTSKLVVITQEKSKQETLEEAALIYASKPRRFGTRMTFIDGAKWQEQQVIEEVFEWLTTNNYLTDLKETLIENFKNK
jgi:hypothetical protein